MAILVYPMLCSSSVSPNALPGIAKVLEQFTLVYRFDDVMSDVRRRAQEDVRMFRGGRLKLKEFEEFEGADFIEEQHPPRRPPRTRRGGPVITTSPTFRVPAPAGGSTSQSRRAQQQARAQAGGAGGGAGSGTGAGGGAGGGTGAGGGPPTQPPAGATTRRPRQAGGAGGAGAGGGPPDARERREIERARREEERFEAQQANVDIHTVNLGGELTAVPTYVRVQTSYGDAILGVKVIPMPVESDVNLAELIMDDRYVTKLEAFAAQAWRAAAKSAYKIWYAALGKIPGLGRIPLSGDIQQDVFYSRTVHRDLIFTCISTMDLDNDFFKEAGGITKLFRLGWSSIISADDVNKRAIFCMKEFKGLCSTIPYSFIYSTLDRGSSHYKVFETLEDVRRASSPFFKLSKKRTKLLGECLACSKLSQYVGEQEEYSDSNPLTMYAKRLTPEKAREFKEDTAKAIVLQVPDKLKSAFKKLHLTGVTFEDVISKAKESNPHFMASFSLSKKVLGNSLSNYPHKLIDLLAAFVAVKSTFDTEKPVEDTKDNLKKVVGTLRSNSRLKRMRVPDPQTVVFILLSTGWLTLMIYHPIYWMLLTSILYLMSILHVILPGPAPRSPSEW